MDRSVKAPGEEWSTEKKQIVGALVLAGGLPALAEVMALSVWVAPVYGGPAQDVPLQNPVASSWHIIAAQDLVWTPQAWAGLGTIALTTVAGVVGTAVAVRAACEKCREIRELRADRKAARKAAKASAGQQRLNTLPRRPMPIAPERIDTQARFMARGAELDDMSVEAMRDKAADLGVQLRDGDAPGLMIARAVIDGRQLYASYEDLHLDLWGPRSGKTTSRVIPAVLEAPGAVVTTSNKRDVVDATRTARDLVGDVHVFDPQGVAGEACTWFWDPIAWVAGPDGGAGAQERAAELAGRFAEAVDSARGDAFFEPEGEDLLAGLFLACALGKRPITQAFAWVTDVEEREPIEILRKGGFGLLAAALQDQYNAPDKQRGGVFSTAKKMAAALKYERIRPWVEPAGKGEALRREFKVEDFVTGRDTLYALSKEGKGNAGPLVTALCAAVAAAAEAEGARHRGGRLPVPMLIVLDEAANIVKWADLPKQYSHFGSRGIVVMTILQSWAQGVRCWGSEGMSALLSAANVLTLGAGLKDTSFLRDMSELVGGHYELVTSTSTSHAPNGGGTSTSTSTQRVTEITLTPSDLAALPKGRVLVFTSGRRGLLAATVPWFQRPYAGQVQAALDDLYRAPIPAAPRLRAVPPWTDTDEEGQTA
ncbi:type IV secretory system conjugative DNA transfer family protein [Nocardia yamanashiensis]|uniref:type IV secretory system conjugative DNA transfer family protein n=1 Tax=Nocardia yamanashiensis TaxID=209247 RepID=UPI0008328253|nr:type IV secretory system conjugative DNA transfer family protein [Nocardia yamanashiensis]